jgi:hypothetical protein
MGRPGPLCLGGGVSEDIGVAMKKIITTVAALNPQSVTAKRRARQKPRWSPNHAETITLTKEDWDMIETCVMGYFEYLRSAYRGEEENKRLDEVWALRNRIIVERIPK